MLWPLRPLHLLLSALAAAVALGVLASPALATEQILALPPAHSAGHAVFWDNVLMLFGMVAYLLFGLYGAFTFVRRRPWMALALVAMVVGALALRMLSAPRVPVIAATADFSHVAAWATLERTGLSALPISDHASAAPILLGILFNVFGRSLDLAFVAFTFLGALAVVPTGLLAERLSGKLAAAPLAALAVATSIPFVYFSNGVSSEVLQALLAVWSFVHLLAFLDHGRRVDLIRYVIALFLIAHCRPEAPLFLVFLVMAQVALLVDERGLRKLLQKRSVQVAGALLVGAAAVALLARIQKDAGAGGHVPMVVHGALSALAWFAAGVAALAGLEWSLRRWPKLRAPWTLLVLVAGLAVLLWAFAVAGPGGLQPHPQVCPTARAFVQWTATAEEACQVRQTDVLTSPIFTPVFWLPLLIFALLPARRPSFVGMARPLLAGATTLLVLLTGGLASGEIMAEGVRYQVPGIPPLAVALGVGAARFVEIASVQRFVRVAFLVATDSFELALVRLASVRRVAIELAVLIAVFLATPLLTHNALYRDVMRNGQQEFRVLDAAIRALPVGATVLLPDNGPPPGEHGYDTSSPHHQNFRGHHMVAALSYVYEKDLHILRLGAAVRAGAVPASNTFVYLGVDCYRVAAPETEAPVCRSTREVLDAPAVVERKPANKLLSSALLLVAPPQGRTLDLGVYPLSPAAVARLAERLPPSALEP